MSFSPEPSPVTATITPAASVACSVPQMMMYHPIAVALPTSHRRTSLVED